MTMPAKVAKACPVCGAPTHARYEDLYDDRYGYPGLFSLLECAACGHLHVPAHFKPEELGQLYTQYYPRGSFALDSFSPEEERHGFSSWMNGDRGSAFRWVPRDVRVLDIGCGVGQTLAYHMARGCEAVGMEADANVQPIAARFGLDIRQGIFDGTQFEAASFDYVTLDQVAEHAVDPNTLMQGIARVLKPGGKVIITTPNPNSLGARLYGRRWLNWHTPYHLQFYTPKSLGMVARRAGLMVVSGQTLTASEWQYFQWRHAMLFPRRGEKSTFWSAVTEKRKRFSLGRIVIGVARRLRAQRWISRALDLAGLGDNHVFVLRKP